MPRRDKVTPGRKRTPPLEVRRSRVHGRGAFATRRIRKGARVIEYAGKRITTDEAWERYGDDEDKKHNHTFLFEIGRDRVIDARQQGNDARFINHSCEPNCEAVQDGDRIFIAALKNIQPGVELAYDYRLSRSGPLPASWRTLYACRCGAAKCRGTLLSPLRRKKKGRAKASRSMRRG